MGPIHSLLTTLYDNIEMKMPKVLNNGLRLVNYNFGERHCVKGLARLVHHLSRPTSVPDSGMKLLILTVWPGAGMDASLRLCMKG